MWGPFQGLSMVCPIVAEYIVKRSANQHRHLMSWNGCSHSHWVLRPILTVTTVWNTGETGDISILLRLCNRTHLLNTSHLSFFIFFYVGPPREDIFYHLLWSIFQSVFTQLHMWSLWKKMSMLLINTFQIFYSTCQQQIGILNSFKHIKNNTEKITRYLGWKNVNFAETSIIKWSKSRRNNKKCAW